MPPDLLLIGANHRTCPVGRREQLVRRVSYRRFAAARDRGVLEDLIVLTTCNRVETYALVADLEAARRELLDGFGAPADSDNVYELRGTDAAAHLFRVAAGLDSVAHGEEQVADQVRRAPDGRPRSWRPPGGLRDLFVRAAREAPRIRRLAGLRGPPMSAGHAASRYLREMLPTSTPTVAFIGSGKMVRLAAETLVPRARLIVVSRDAGKARAAAGRLGGRAATLDRLPRILHEADAIVAATSATRPILRRRALERAMAARSRRPLWIVDLGMPRNVEPGCAELPGVTLLNIDGLAPWAWRPLGPAAHARAERRIWNRAIAALDALRPREADSVAALRRAAEEWRRREVDRALALLPDRSDEARRIVDKMADRLVNRLLHGPTSVLRKMQVEGRADLVADLIGEWRARGQMR